MSSTNEKHHRLIAPCVRTCPAGVDVPRYIGHVERGEFGEADSVVRETIPLALVCGRVCYRPCEAKCRRGVLDQPVQINALKRAAGEFSNGLPWGDRWGDSKAADSGKRVAVVGAGPAGLTAAYYLGKVCGHQVTLYESETEPGGQLYLGVPTFRLPRNVLRQEIQLICETRVELVCGHRIESLQRLIEQGFDAVFISIGAWAPVSLPISKAHLPEVVPSVEILRKANLGIFPKIGDRVRVIGGGNVAVDGARVALRLGAKDVKVLYRRSRKEMPAVESEVSTAEKEGVKFEFLVSPVAIEEQPGGRLGLQLEETQLGEPDESGRPRPISTGRRSFQEGISQILIAAGQRPEIPPEWELDMNPEGTIKANRDTLETSLPGIFAGGDVTTGPLNFIGAVAHGRVAARSIDRFLGGRGDITEILASGEGRDLFPTAMHSKGYGPVLPTHSDEEKTQDGFAGDEPGLNSSQAREEALRCLRCDLWRDQGVPAVWETR